MFCYYLLVLIFDPTVEYTRGRRWQGEAMRISKPGHDDRIASGSRAEMRRLPPGVPLAFEYTYVRHAKRGVAQGVTHRVDGAVDVAQVVEKIPHALRHPLLAAAAVRSVGLATAARVRGKRFQQH